MINSSMFGDFYLYNSLNTEERFYRSIPMSAENIHTTKFIQQKNYFVVIFSFLSCTRRPMLGNPNSGNFSHIETGTYPSGRSFIHRAVKIWNSLPDNIVAL